MLACRSSPDCTDARTDTHCSMRPTVLVSRAPVSMIFCACARVAGWWNAGKAVVFVLADDGMGNAVCGVSAVAEAEAD